MVAAVIAPITAKPAWWVHSLWGANVHLGRATPNFYGTHTATAIATALAGAGITMVRDTYGGQTSGDASQFDLGIAACAAAGIQYGFSLIPHGSGSTFSTRLTQLQASGYTPAFLESYNEWDGSGGGSQTGTPPGWESDLIAAQPTLHTAKTGSLASCLMLCPPLVSNSNSVIKWPTLVTAGWDVTKADGTNLHIYTHNAATGGSATPESASFGFPIYLGTNAFAGCPTGPKWCTEFGIPNANSIEVAAIGPHTCTIPNASATYTDPSASSALVGTFPVGTGITTGAKVTGVSGTTVTISINTTAAGSSVPVSYGDNSNGFLPELAAAKWALRGGLYLALQGFEEVVLYEAADQPQTPNMASWAGGEGRFGHFFHWDLTTKPLAAALGKIVTTSNDSSSYAGGTVNIGVSYNGTNNVYQSGTSSVWWDVYQYANGDLLFFCWLGSLSWSGGVAGQGWTTSGQLGGGTDVNFPPNKISVSLPTGFGVAEIYKPLVQTAPIAGIAGGDHFSFDPDDGVTMVLIKNRRYARSVHPYPVIQAAAA